MPKPLVTKTAVTQWPRSTAAPGNINPLELSVPKIATLIQGFVARMAKRPFLLLTFGHSGTQG